MSLWQISYITYLTRWLGPWPRVEYFAYQLFLWSRWGCLKPCQLGFENLWISQHFSSPSGISQEFWSVSSMIGCWCVSLRYNLHYNLQNCPFKLLLCIWGNGNLAGIHLIRQSLSTWAFQRLSSVHFWDLGFSSNYLTIAARIPATHSWLYRWSPSQW